MAQSVTPRSEDYSRWYTDVVQMAELADYAPVPVREPVPAVWAAVES